MKRVENDRVFAFLEGLNKNLDEVRGRILGRKPPLSSLHEIFDEVAKGRRKEMIGENNQSLPEVSSLVSKANSFTHFG